MMKCKWCGKELSYDTLWEWVEVGITSYFCSQKCLDKWLSVIRKEANG